MAVLFVLTAEFRASENCVQWFYRFLRTNLVPVISESNLEEVLSGGAVIKVHCSASFYVRCEEAVWENVGESYVMHYKQPLNAVEKCEECLCVKKKTSI